MICVPFASHNLKLCTIFFTASVLGISGTNFKSTGTNFQEFVRNEIDSKANFSIELIFGPSITVVTKLPSQRLAKLRTTSFPGSSRRSKWRLGEDPGKQQIT